MLGAYLFNKNFSMFNLKYSRIFAKRMLKSSSCDFDCIICKLGV